jgi:hypothetical protein
VIPDPDRSAFFDDGFVYLRGALSVSAAREMEDAVWSVLSASGVHRDNRATWSADYEVHLQAVRKQDRPPAEVPAVRLVLDDLLGAGTWTRPRNWGQVLLTFPTAPPWSPRGGLWHLDHPFSLPGGVITGVNVFLFVADAGERGGGTLILRGSPALVARFVAEGGEVAGEKMSVTRRRFFGSREVLREMTRAPGPDLARFMAGDFDVDGVPARVVELTGKAGDIVVCHPWALHMPSANVAGRPRIMRASRIYRRRPGPAGDAGLPPGD